MSELEIKKRQEYKKNRKKWIIVQFVVILLLAATTLGLFIGYNQTNKAHRIEYSESSHIDYKVQYVDNEFFEEEWIGKDQSYIASLVNGITADFAYTLNTDSWDMGFDYTYSIDATLLVADKDSKNPFYSITEPLLTGKTGTSKSRSTILIRESVGIDYVKFNELAKSFTDTYDLQNSSCTLIVTLNVEILCSNDRFDQKTANTYTTSLNIPVADKTFRIHSTSSSPEGEIKILEYKSIADRDFFYVSGIITSSLTILCIAALLVFMHLTKNEDITYSAKIRKILKSYGSYIQRIDGEFDCDGYQIVMIKTFIEMLGIRDTIQSPILVFENKDETMTSFLIPTNTKILYVFEIKVDNFDQIYGTSKETDEEPVILANINEEDLAEAFAQPDPQLEEIEFIPDDDDQFECKSAELGVEVIGVVWPERQHNNKVYRYDPNGEILHEGDIVLVPTRDTAKGADVIRKATVAHGNHSVDPEHIKHPLKQIIAVIKRRVSLALTPESNQSDANND